MPIGDRLSDELETVATDVVDAAYRVHLELGPGLLESVYHEALAYELNKRGRRVDREVAVPIYYDGYKLSDPLRIDLLVASSVIVEVKAVLVRNPVFKSQVLTYLKLSRLRLGFVINFNVQLIKEGIERVINFEQTASSRPLMLRPSL